MTWGEGTPTIGRLYSERLVEALGPALVVGGALLLVAGVLIAIGKRRVSKVSPPKRTLRTSKDTVSFLKRPRTPHAQP
jgi:hypothetical protein